MSNPEAACTTGAKAARRAFGPAWPQPEIEQ